MPPEGNEYAEEGPHPPLGPGEMAGEPAPPEYGGERRTKFVVGDVPVFVVAERVQYLDKNGKLITESVKDYARHAVRKAFSTLGAFLKKWSEVDRKQVVVQELAERGVFFEELAKEVGKDFSPFDIVCHVAFDQPPLTRKERANNVRKRNYFTKYGEAARAVLDALLRKYADEGVDDIENIQVLRIQPLTKFGTPLEIIQKFGGREQYLQAVRELEEALYDTAS